MTYAQQPIWHTLIIGGGAAGLFCAGSFGAEKVLLEHNPQVGAKLNISGGGKCNFSNIGVSPRDYVSHSKHFCHNALASFKPQHFLQLLQENHIPFEEKENGQLFAHRAADITQMLTLRAQEMHTHIKTHVEVLKIQKEKDIFRTETSAGTFYSLNLVLACGGLSYPALGASGFAAKAAAQLGLPVIEQRPVLVSLQAPKPWRESCRQLAGNSLEALVSVGKHKEKGSLLFTHEGFSGPVILQTSLYWQEEQEIRINFMPSADVMAVLQQHKNEPVPFSKILSPYINARLCKTWLGPLDVRASDAKKETLLAVVRQLNQFSFIPSGTGGYTHAEATAGGIDCACFNPHTMECKNMAGLFAIGEALDVTGRLGGYNLHWAWASAAAAAQLLKQR